MHRMVKEVQAYIEKFVSLSEAELKLLRESLQVMTCLPKQVLTSAGEEEKHIYFIQKGIIRKYICKGKEEITIQLSKEGDLVTSGISYLSGKASDIYLETIEASTLVFITKADLEKLFAFSNNFEKMGRLIWLEWMLSRERWDVLRMTKAPRERLRIFLQDKPALSRRVSQKYIASLLNMKPETLSRYKKMETNPIEP